MSLAAAGAGESLSPTPFVAQLDRLAIGVEMNEAEMRAWGHALGGVMPRGAMIALHGDLGAGKTSLVRALAIGLGVQDITEVSSPTYALVHEYASPHGVVVHADLYRVRRVDELDEAGWDDLIADARAVLVEWPARAGERLPAHTVHLELAHVAGAPDVRRIGLRRRTR